MGAARRAQIVDAQPELNGLAPALPIDPSFPPFPSLQQAVDEAEADLARGEHVEHDEVMTKLRRWMDGT